MLNRFQDNLHWWRKTYKSFGLKGTDAVKDHVQRPGEQSPFSRWASHSEGLTAASDPISEEKSWAQKLGQIKFVCEYFLETFRTKWDKTYEHEFLQHIY